MRDASEFENEEEFRIIGNENSEDKSLGRPSVVKVSEMNTIVWFILQNTIPELTIGEKKEKWRKRKYQTRNKNLFELVSSITILRKVFQYEC